MKNGHSEISDFEVLVLNGTMIPFDKELFRNEFPEGQRLRIRVIKSKPNASKEAFGYFGFLCSWLSKNTNQFAGYTPKQIRAIAKSMFLSHAITYEYEGKVVECNEIPSLSGISAAEFRQFLDQWIAWLATEGITVPEPKNVNLDPFHVDDSAVYNNTEFNVDL